MVCDIAQLIALADWAFLADVILLVAISGQLLRHVDGGGVVHHHVPRLDDVWMLLEIERVPGTEVGRVDIVQFAHEKVALEVDVRRLEQCLGRVGLPRQWLLLVDNVRLEDLLVVGDTVGRDHAGQALDIQTKGYIAIFVCLVELFAVVWKQRVPRHQSLTESRFVSLVSSPANVR